MRAQNGVSRRHMLAMSAVAGGVAIGSGFRGASAQAGKRIEQYAPESLDETNAEAFVEAYKDLAKMLVKVAGN